MQNRLRNMTYCIPPLWVGSITSKCNNNKDKIIYKGEETVQEKTNKWNPIPKEKVSVEEAKSVKTENICNFSESMLDNF